MQIIISRFSAEMLQANFWARSLHNLLMQKLDKVSDSSGGSNELKIDLSVTTD